MSNKVTTFFFLVKIQMFCYVFYRFKQLGKLLILIQYIVGAATSQCYNVDLPPVLWQRQQDSRVNNGVSAFLNKKYSL